MTEIILKVREARSGELGFFPVDDEGAEVLHKVKTGREVSGDIKQKRHPKHHRLFFAILKFLRLHAERFENMPTDKIKDAVKLATGLADTFIDAETGETYYVLRSISWASMDETEFTRFFDQACLVIANRWMPPNTTAESVRTELLAMIDGPSAIGSRVA